MNCFSGCTKWLRHTASVLALGFVAACGVSDSESADRQNAREYSVHFTLTPEPASATVKVDLRLRQPHGLLRELSFPESADIEALSGDGELQVYESRVRWQPPPRGGTLRWRIAVHSERGDGSFDALLTPGWGVFRMEDVIPRARSRTVKGAQSRTTLSFDLPAGWSAVTEYPTADGKAEVNRAGRRFDEPAGWVAVGNLGVRRETIAGLHVAVAAPKNHGVRRMDMLALLNWTLPELVAILPDALPRLTVVGAGEPMWRGGLSGPASFFIHADRPLISENATSALLHEVMHTALGIRPLKGYDWIAEGLAEYYSIELLRRGRGITPQRAATAFADQAAWAEAADELCAEHSTAETTALAVTVFASLNRQLEDASGGEASLDSLLPMLADSDVDLESLAGAAEQLAGATPEALHIDNLPGCLEIP
jgi:hypothetical protein